MGMSIRTGMRVKTQLLHKRTWVPADKENLDARKHNITGTVIGTIPANYANAWWVEHDNHTVGAYSSDELKGIRL